MPTGVALMMASKDDLARASFLMVLEPDWRASFCAVSAVRLRMKTLAPFSRRPNTAARAAPPAPSTSTLAPASGIRFSSGPVMPATSVLKP